MKTKIKRLLKNERGLTLVELLAVIVILGIIAAIAIPSIGKIIDNSKVDAHIANAEQLVGAARLAVAANDKTLWGDSNGDTKGQITAKELKDNGYLESEIKDPDSDVNYTTANVVYNENSNTFTVNLVGSKRSIENIDVTTNKLKRSNVVSNTNTNTNGNGK